MKRKEEETCFQEDNNKFKNDTFYYQNPSRILLILCSINILIFFLNNLFEIEG